MTDIDILIDQATAKLDRIIKREGDDNGNRLKPEYFQILLDGVIQEDLMQLRYRKSCEVTA